MKLIKKYELINVNILFHCRDKQRRVKSDKPKQTQNTIFRRRSDKFKNKK